MCHFNHKFYVVYGSVCICYDVIFIVHAILRSGVVVCERLPVQSVNGVCVDVVAESVCFGPHHYPDSECLGLNNPDC